MRKQMKQFVLIVTAIFMAHILVTSLFASDVSEWEDLNGRMVGFYKEQKFMKASGTGRQAVEVARKLPAENRDKLASSLGNLSMIYTHLGKFPEAEELAKEELTVRQELYGKDSREVITAWNHLSIIYTMAAQMAPSPDAEHCLIEIIAIEEKTNGNESLAVIPSLEKLEKYYKITGEKAKEQKVTARINELRPPTEAVPAVE